MRKLFEEIGGRKIMAATSRKYNKEK